MSDDQLSGKWPAVELPEAWVWTKFSDFWSDYTDTKKKIPQKQYLPEGQFAVVDQGEALIGGYTNDKELLSNAPVPSIVFGDHTRAVKFVEVPFAQGADGVRVLGTPSGIEPRFAYQALRAVDLPNKGYSRHFKFLKATEFPLPPLAEQRRIVAQLDALSARSARARKDLARIDTLVKRYKQAVLSKAFYGELTKDWPKKTLQSLCEQIFDGPFGSNLKSADYTDTGPRVIRLENIGVRTFIGEKETHISDEKFKDLAKHRLQSRDLLFSSFVSEEIRACLFPKDADFQAINKADCFCLRFDARKVDPEFALLQLSCEETYQFFAKQVHGATRPRINLRQLKAYEICVPSLAEQNSVVRQIESGFQKIDKLAAEAKRALELTNKLDEAILTKAFRGELVPQDPNDEPASVLLERIKVERAAAPKSRPSRTRRVKTMKTATDFLNAKLDSWPETGHSFHDLKQEFGGNYEELKAAVFELLSDEKSGLKQVFDEATSTMTFKKQT